MSFDTNWDIDYYRTEHESDEHWQLRRRFMEYHKERFPEDEVVCLAQVFTNVEFMGCRYPDETMRLVAELSQEVAHDFREGRAQRIKRTFVKASDAAEARAKGTKRSQPISHAQGSNKRATNLLSNLPFGQFVLFMIGDRNCISHSGVKTRVEVVEKESVERDDIKRHEIFVGGKLAGSGSDPALKTAKLNAFEDAKARLLRECFAIKISPNADRINVTKTNEIIECNLQTCESEPKIDTNNIGYKMMQKLGWSGGGLGSAKKGRENPVDYLIKNNRRGLGNNSGDINKAYFKDMLTNYVKSEDIRDLYFESGFTKDERAELHQIAKTMNLKSSSYGKEPNRHLIISKKDISPLQILNEVLIHRNSMYANKYEVTVPENRRDEFPDHVAFKSE